MYENDYILRVIGQMGVMLRAMLNEMRTSETEELFETSREALQLLLGLPPTVAETLTPDGYVAMLSAGGVFDTKRGRLVAEVLVRRAQAARLRGEQERSDRERAKAERLIALVLEGGDDDDRAEAEALAEELAGLE
jgi:Tfp pilus assembly protein FimV